MKLRAVIFDVYKTILDVGPPPRDAEQQWQALGRELLGASPRMSLVDFTAAAERVIAREHATARAAGIPFPEIFWPDIAAEALPELSAITATARDEFLYRQQTLFRTVRLMAGAADVLRMLTGRGLSAGIASNAQPYSLRELDAALAPAGLSRELFQPELCFWSFAHGFSKPDPHVFRLLTARLGARGVTPEAVLMVGDRNDNDIAPAKAQRWRTWRLAAGLDGETGGEWEQLGRFLAEESVS